MPSNVHVCVEKAARYLDLEERYVYCDEEHLCLDPSKAITLVDENTVGIICILGSTYHKNLTFRYTGEYEDVKEMNRLLEELNIEKGLDVRIHVRYKTKYQVDAASGGFVAPFLAPDLVWDFRLPLVNSINSSGHKYGLTYAGVGWAIWRGTCLASPETKVVCLTI